MLGLTKKQRRNIKRTSLNILEWIFKLAVCVMFLFPFYWMVITSFKPYLETLQFPPTLWPETFTLSGYFTVFEELEVLRYIKNTLIVTGSVIVLQFLVNIPAAYAFAKWEYKGKGMMWAIVLATFMIPGQLTFMTIYYMFADWGILNSLLPQILPTIASAFSIFMLRQNFKQISDEVVEAARLDNASEWKILWRVMVPMAKSTVITTVLFSFIGHWNAYFWPLVMTRNEELKPITLAIDRLKSLEQGMNYTDIMAGNVILVLPVVILFLLASKKIIQAMAYRGMK
ncbi:MAG: carbohydrate ABC transporter permease [Tyzzerella sp.]|nr:carbohydrate ABC transporter permease [Tyzzerella sp.]